jgi:predicted unusual protein kinase regulating ubiquinone biosynthesis (AarF/ABC1/UbiB family)
VLGDIDPVGRAASLGQVHRARLRDGTSVAVKVQYPGIREAVRSDLNLLGWLSAPVGNLRRGFDMRAYRRVLRQCLDEELDYRHEADNQAAFFRFAGAEPGLAVPELFPEFVTETVLVSSWEDGDDWDTVRAKWTVDEKRRLAEELLAVFLRGIFDRGMMHADWHPGNVRFRRGGRSPQVLLYDFGCVLRMPRQQSDALLRLIRATMREDESPWPPMIALGFDREFLEPIAAKLPALCRVLFEPFLVEYRYDLADWRLAERVGDILGDDRWNFRIAGPADLILLLRAWHGATY